MYMCESVCESPQAAEAVGAQSVSLSVPTDGRGRAMDGYMIWRSVSGPCESSKYCGAEHHSSCEPQRARV